MRPNGDLIEVGEFSLPTSAAQAEAKKRRERMAVLSDHKILEGYMRRTLYAFVDWPLW